MCPGADPSRSRDARGLRRRSAGRRGGSDARDILSEFGRHEDGTEAYTTALERSGNRLHGLDGAGRAAELLGRRDKAFDHYDRLIAIAKASRNRESVIEGAIVYVREGGVHP